MNKAQQKVLEEAKDHIAIAVGKLDDLKNEIADKLDSMSEKAKEGEKGEELTELLSRIEDALSNAESAESEIDAALEP